MDPRRLSQLERAMKLRANVSVLLGQGEGAPIVVELAAVRRSHLEDAVRVYVQVLSWIDDRPPVEFSVLHEDDNWRRATEEDLARGVDEALDRFEERPRSASSSG